MTQTAGRKTATLLAAACLAALFGAGAAQAACEGGLGRGWSKGNGNGKFTMRSADKSCVVGFANFIDAKENLTPATQVELTTAPKSGKITIGKTGVTYTPQPGFKGKDKFCTKNTTPEVKGKSLRGCVTVTVN